MSCACSRTVADRDGGRELGRVAVDAARDRRERDRARAELARDVERAAVARREQLGLAGVAAAPDRADGVNDVPRGQLARRGRLRVAGLAAAEQPALGKDRRPARAMDRPVDAAAAEQASCSPR